MARARSGNAIQSKIQMTIYGEPFTGKSTMASQFAYMKNPDGSPFKVLYLDPESGSIDDYLGTMKANGVNPANIWIVYTQSLTEVLDYISRATNNEDFYEIDDDGNETDTVVLDGDGKPFRPDAIVVDGTSVLNLTTKQGIIEFSKKRANVKADIAGLIGDARLVKVDKEIPHSMFHRYGYLYNDADWGDPVVRDLDVNKRYYIGNVDKNRFGQKKKLLFELNLDTNVWVELGEAVKK